LDGTKCGPGTDVGAAQTSHQRDIVVRSRAVNSSKSGKTPLRFI
jgi:hypothetical protein